MLRAMKTCIAISIALLAMISGQQASAKSSNKKAEAPKVEKETAADEAPLDDDDAPIDELSTFKHETGPKLITLGDGLELDLPAGFAMIDPSEFIEEFKKQGADVTGYKGSIVALADPAAWRLDIQFQDKGYVTDTDAADLNAKELFDSYVQGTNAMNETRRKNGIDELFIDNWQTEPHYAKVEHALMWGINAHSKDGKVVNDITNILGRRGLVELNLIGDAETIGDAQKASESARHALRFKAGERYEDFNEATDKSSGLGLQALVLGGVGVAVAKKTGLLVVLLLGLKKVGVFIIAPIALFFKKLFGRAKSE
jgi:uncharacterized membrane-anchored protein